MAAKNINFLHWDYFYANKKKDKEKQTNQQLIINNELSNLLGKRESEKFH